ncbi:peptidylprolyl isomerase [Rubellimicrobium aerolatum]|uniref:Peptidyl-prolyl cis-trans isomerase n=1 Tax=Rubellimicrobium aerolatum TaxID=490979 RepID=A0ABW0S7Y7_9RHOB|nr:peptidylprolyl isomerase [Rubellimicrobium aerolatum]MBP1804414.1 peptidyl-prolyl cis-trans isomerase D [Rubellimicrobium aerolatum]
MAARRNSKWIYWLMVGGILLGFGGWFTGGGGARSTAVGTVGGLEISAQSYANALQNQLRQIEEQSGQRLTLEQAQALGLDRAVLAHVVTRRVLDAEARRLGLSAGDARVAEAVLATPGFQGLDGQFDREVYREQLRRNGLTEAAFETALREDTARTILQAAILGGVARPETYAEVLSAWTNETRAVTWAPVGAEGVTLPEPTAEQLRAYYDAHPGDFTAPEVRQVGYAWITPEMIQAELPVDDAAVRELYESRRDEFVQEERRLVERLVYPDEAQAQAARARVDAGEAGFEDLVAERGLLLADADLGDVSRAELGAAGEAVFAAGTGSVVGPLPSDLGPALYRVNAVLAAQETSLEEAAPGLRTEIANEAAREVIAGIEPQVQDLLAGGATVEDIARRTDLEAGQVAWSEGATEGPAAYQEFRDAAAAAREGASPEIVPLADGGLLVLRLDGVTPPALRPFEEVEAEARAGWEAQARREAVLARAEAGAEAIAGGASFEDQGLAPVTEPALARRGAIEGTPPGFVEAAFGMQRGATRALPSGEGAVVLRLDSVTPAQADDPAVIAERAAVESQVSGSLSQDLIDAVAQALQAGTEIRIDDQAIAAVNAQIN